jgi:formate dehydrogenase maturation protein FdhE
MRGGCHRAAGLIVVLALAGLAGGCGGSSAPTKATYGKNVDKLCNTLDDRVSAIQRQAPKTTDDLVKFADDLEKVIEDGVSQLDDVERPDGEDGKKAEAWINELTKQKDEAIKPALEELKKAAKSKDTAAIQRAVERIQRVDEKKVNQLARDAGARSCGDAT